MELNEISGAVVSGAFKIHTALGPGLLESVYEACLEYELQRGGFQFARQRELPVRYEGIELPCGFRLDLIVEERMIVEVKAVERILPIHTAQLLTYLKLTGCQLGLILNFNVVHMRDGIKRIIST
ncbi:MAG: GxxExxY protein [Burkholderiales bacterium]